MRVNKNKLFNETNLLEIEPCDENDAYFLLHAILLYVSKCAWLT